MALMTLKQPLGGSSVNWFNFLPLSAGASWIDFLVPLAPDLVLSTTVMKQKRVSYFRFSAPLAKTGIKLSNVAALLDFQNVIRPSESNPDSEANHCGLDAQNRHLFPHVSERGKVFLGPMASRD